ncbi:hypothetical protein K1T71_012210 [Dendrolimus kikuchii]|uniref:Uncharacterized protein n=1 Tax=Dendrolimus kikuchii TaxID=765133 RepID=A0ACC1CL67_9NEOP|nr:hypothetical protein K1T71_012210 [Dendrolimus kikuchii]
MSEVLKELVAKRGSLKGIITRLQVFILSNALEAASSAQLQVRLLRLQKSFSELEDVNNKISLLDPNDKEDVSIVEDIFYEISAALNELIEQSNKDPRLHTNQHHRDLALPVIKIEPFDDNNLCNICLGSHRRRCKFHFRCIHCKKKHNSLLHPNDQDSVTLLTTHDCGNDGHKANPSILCNTKLKDSVADTLPKFANNSNVYCHMCKSDMSDVSFIHYNFGNRKWFHKNYSKYNT